MKPKRVLTHEKLKELLNYCPISGVFTRRIGTLETPAGAIADRPQSKGYMRLCVLGSQYLSHRVAWFYVHGVWPSEIDHIDMNKTNNAISNLRVVTSGQNKENRKFSQANNMSCGLLGVTWDKSKGKWQAQINVNKKHIFIGRYTDKNEAHKAYLEKKRELHTGCTI